MAKARAKAVLVSPAAAQFVGLLCGKGFFAAFLHPALLGQGNACTRAFADQGALERDERSPHRQKKMR